MGRKQRASSGQGAASMTGRRQAGAKQVRVPPAQCTEDVLAQKQGTHTRLGFIDTISMPPFSALQLCSHRQVAVAGIPDPLVDGPQDAPHVAHCANDGPGCCHNVHCPLPAARTLDRGLIKCPIYNRLPH